MTLVFEKTWVFGSKRETNVSLFSNRGKNRVPEALRANSLESRAAAIFEIHPSPF